MTSEWRYYAGGFGYSSYYTIYFDGYETINGYVYYKKYRKTLSHTSFFRNTTTQLSLHGPYYIREDVSGKFYIYDQNNDQDVEEFDNQQIINAQIGDIFPEFGATCDVESFETNYLGSVPLKRIKSNIDCDNCGVIEGIGKVGPTCEQGIEANTYLKCYSKQGVEIQFGTPMDCDSFPVPVRESLNVDDNETAKEDFILYPNPTKDIFTIMSNSLSAENKYEIHTVMGRKVKSGTITSDEQIIDISSLSNGVYLIKIIGNNTSKIRRLIKK
ncbi:MAG TPA: T9SS type A sorting domain-containing protein [Flavobacterium sp.]|uniref:T9SS type A sorting domain-containing protein n=1 Tax=unclassified Flavobacterium TaxID=196869 RepID=UPI0025B91DB4|nr:MULTISPECIES: T9SS type A sorting domain-containing protein [unclassified Flavobacterium]HRE78129.1 T9SS type A sorting domain-containing protein [Flavobacterium sp.]